MYSTTTKPGFNQYSLIDFIISRFEGEQLPIKEEDKALAIPGKEAPKGWSDGMVDPRAEEFCWVLAIRLKKPTPLTTIAPIIGKYLTEMNWHTSLGGEGVSSDPNWEDGVLAIPELYGIQAMCISLFTNKDNNRDLHIMISPVVC